MPTHLHTHYCVAHRLFLCALLTLATACVPILPHDEYVPEMTHGKIFVEGCWGQKRVEYQVDGIAMTARIIKWPPGLLKLEFMFDVPEGNTLELLSQDVRITSRTANTTNTTRIPGISLTENPSLPLEPMGAMVGRDIVIYGKRLPRHFWLFAPVEDIVSDEMRITLPTVKINGRAVTIPDIQFTRRVRIQLMAPVQC